MSTGEYRSASDERSIEKWSIKLRITWIYGYSHLVTAIDTVFAKSLLTCLRTHWYKVSK